MKKLLAILLSLIMLFALAACVGPEQTESEAASAAAGNNVPTVGIAMPTNSLERWNRDGAYLKEQFESIGYNTVLTYSNDNIEQQNNDIQTMIADGVDLLIVVAINGKALSRTLSEAKDAGIPVIAYDRLIMNSDAISCYVSFDNYNVGTLQGEFVRDALKLDTAEGPFNIEFTAGDPADNNAIYFFNGAFDVLKPYIDEGKLIVPSGQTTFEQAATPLWSIEGALNRFQNILASYYSDGTILDAAVCSNDSTAIGVTRAIATDYAGDNRPIITGQDGNIANLQNIVDGIQTMTIYKNVSDEAILTLEVAEAILNGKSIDGSLIDDLSPDATFDPETYDNGVMAVPSYLLKPSVITADNLDDLVATGLYQWDDDHIYLEAAG